MTDDKPKYYGTVTELQEIRKAMKYLATSVDNLQQQLKEQNVRAALEQLTLQFEGRVKSIINDAVSNIEIVPGQRSRTELYEELRRYKKAYNWAHSYEERERYRRLINSIMREINENY